MDRSAHRPNPTAAGRRITAPSMAVPPPPLLLTEAKVPVTPDRAKCVQGLGDRGNSAVDVICLRGDSRGVIEEISPAPERSGAGSLSPVCPPCGAAIDPLRARHLSVVAGKIVSFCS